MLAAGADANVVSWDGLTVLDIAEREHQSEVVDMLKATGSRTLNPYRKKILISELECVSCIQGYYFDHKRITVTVGTFESCSYKNANILKQNVCSALRKQ